MPLSEPLSNNVLQLQTFSIKLGAAGVWCCGLALHTAAEGSPGSSLEPGQSPGKATGIFPVNLSYILCVIGKVTHKKRDSAAGASQKVKDKTVLSCYDVKIQAASMALRHLAFLQSWVFNSLLVWTLVQKIHL